MLLVNPASGDGTGPSTDELTEAAAERGVRVVVLDDADDLGAVARHHAVDASALGMAGGDGSLGVVAGESMRADIPFVCIPFGTRNHFALDLGLDRSDPIAALDAFVDRRERVVDVALAGDRVVLNNLTFGVYAEIVHSDAYRDARFVEGTKITREMLRGDREPDDVLVVDPSGEQHGTPFALVVANNAYGADVGPAGLGRRKHLDEGILQVSVIDAGSGWDLASLALSAVVGLVENHGSALQWTTVELDVRSDQDTIRAGLDGEAVRLATPVHVRVAPLALRMLIPSSAIVVDRRHFVKSLVDSFSPDGT